MYACARCLSTCPTASISMPCNDSNDCHYRIAVQLMILRSSVETTVAAKSCTAESTTICNEHSSLGRPSSTFVRLENYAYASPSKSNRYSSPKRPKPQSPPRTSFYLYPHLPHHLPSPPAFSKSTGISIPASPALTQTFLTQKNHIIHPRTTKNGGSGN
jgi:hypothetical protein